MKDKYRIVTDYYNGYESQIKRWWFPFWLQISGDKGSINCNTNTSIAEAEKLIELHKNGITPENPHVRKVVKYIL